MTATAAALGGLGLVSTSGADDHTASFVLEQDGECYPVVPLSGEEPVEELYRWGRDILSWSSEGTRDLQQSETSILFLYRGPFGLSLVVVHDRADDGTPGGIASFTVSGVPEGAEWVVKDDLYQKKTNVDQWEINGTVLEANESTVTDDIPEVDGNVTVDNVTVDNVSAGNGTVDNVTADNVTVGNTTVANATAANGTDYDARTDEIDWWWTEGRTDGGALRGLAVDGLQLRIDPVFNDDAALAEKTNEGEITSWQLLSGDRDDPDRTELDLGKPVTLRAGGCDGAASTQTAASANTTNASANTTNATDASNVTMNATANTTNATNESS